MTPTSAAPSRWYLVLASRIPWQQALAAVEGWGGDRYRSYVRTVDGAERECVRIAVVGDTDDRHRRARGAPPPRGRTRCPTARRGSSARATPSCVSACATGQSRRVGRPTRCRRRTTALWERTDGMWYFTDRSVPPASAHAMRGGRARRRSPTARAAAWRVDRSCAARTSASSRSAVDGHTRRRAA